MEHIPDFIWWFMGMVWRIVLRGLAIMRLTMFAWAALTAKPPTTRGSGA